MTTPTRKTLRERLDEPWLAEVDWAAEERKSPWPLANVLREGPGARRTAKRKASSATQSLPTLSALATRSRRSRRVLYWLLAVLVPLLMAAMAAAIAQAAVAPSPRQSARSQSAAPALVCQVLDGTPHAQEWLTREDAMQRVDVIRIVLGVDVKMRCRPSSFADGTSWALVVPIVTRHFPQDRGMNDRNWGLAVERQVRPGVWLLAEDFENSVRRNTFVVGVAVLPIHWRNLRLGSAVGLDLTHGYNKNPVAPLLVDGRAVVKVTERWGLGVDLMPGGKGPWGVAVSARWTVSDRRRVR